MTTSETTVAAATEIEEARPLQVVTQKEIQLPSIQKEEKDKAVDPAIQKQVNTWASQLLNFDPNNPEERQDRISAIDQIGQATQTKSAYTSQMLDEPIRRIASTEDGGPVANAMVDLKVTVDGIIPSKFNILAPGSLGRMFTWIPGVGITLNKYFTKFQSCDGVINSIVHTMRQGTDQLVRDNDILKEDQIAMRAITIELEKYVLATRLLDEKLSTEVENLPNDDAKRRFIEEEVIFPLRQRTMDLQQQLAVNQQAVIAIEVLIRNNRELIRGVNRCENVTITALKTAVSICIGLTHQKMVLSTIQKVDETTEELITYGAQTLRTQGVAIQKQASSQNISIQTLTKSLEEVSAAIDDVSNFRREALPQMKQSVTDMRHLTDQAEEVIQKMEKGNRTRPKIELGLDAPAAA